MTAPEPVISVIIPCYNAGPLLDRQLQALADQRFEHPWQLIVADNASTDDSADRARAWQDRLPLEVVDASDVQGASHARNVGAARARCDRLVFLDADDRAAPGLLDAMHLALQSHDLVAGMVDFSDDDRPIPEGIDWVGRPILGFLPYAISCNLGISRRAFDAGGRFDETLMTAHDVALSWRAQLAGYPLVCEPRAVVHRSLPPTTWGAFRRRFEYGTEAPALYRRFHHFGLRRRPAGTVVRHWRQMARSAPMLVDRERRLEWLLRAALPAGRVVGSWRHRVVFL